jgi:hypothetical protein
MSRFMACFLLITNYHRCSPVAGNSAGSSMFFMASPPRPDPGPEQAHDPESGEYGSVT